MNGEYHMIGDSIMDALITLAANRRNNSRHFVSKEARIQFADQNLDILVSLRNMSAGGAKLWVSPRQFLPPEFDLILVCEALVFRVRLCWRAGEYAGVQFIGEPRNIA